MDGKREIECDICSAATITSRTDAVAEWEKHFVLWRNAGQLRARRSSLLYPKLTNPLIVETSSTAAQNEGCLQPYIICIG